MSSSEEESDEEGKVSLTDDETFPSDVHNAGLAGGGIEATEDGDDADGSCLEALPPQKLVFSSPPALQLMRELDPTEKENKFSLGDGGEGGESKLIPSEENARRVLSVVERDQRQFRDEMLVYFRKLRSSDTRRNREAVSELAEHQMRFLVEAAIPEGHAFFAEQLEVHNEATARFVWGVLTEKREAGKAIVEQVVKAAAERFEESLRSMSAAHKRHFDWMRAAFAERLSGSRTAGEKVLERTVRHERGTAAQASKDRDAEYEEATKLLVERYVKRIELVEGQLDTVKFERDTSEKQRRQLEVEHWASRDALNVARKEIAHHRATMAQRERQVDDGQRRLDAEVAKNEDMRLRLSEQEALGEQRMRRIRELTGKLAEAVQRNETFQKRVDSMDKLVGMLRGELSGADERIRHSLEAEARMQTQVEQIKNELIFNETKRIKAEKDALEAKNAEKAALAKSQEADLEMQALTAEKEAEAQRAKAATQRVAELKKEIGDTEVKMLKQMRKQTRRASVMVEKHAFAIKTAAKVRRQSMLV